MSIEHTSPHESFITPDDQGISDVICELISTVKPSNPIRFGIYGFTDKAIMSALIQAHNIGVDVQGILDRSQSQGQIEAVDLDWFFKSTPRFAPDGTCLYTIGESVEDQIIHGKFLYVNYPSPLYNTVIPFANWRDATKAGYPVVLRGSYNWSGTANKQVNTVDICPSLELAAMYDKVWQETRNFNLKTHADWNSPSYSVMKNMVNAPSL